MLSGAKVALASILHGSGITPMVLHLGRRRPLVLRYHRVYPDGAKPFYELGISRSLFEAQLDYLARRHNVVGLDQLLAGLSEQARLPDRAVAITFDDGYRDNFSEAFPALRRRQMPATLFVSAGNLDRREPFWWDRLASAVESARSVFEVDVGAGTERFELDGPVSRRRAFDRIREGLKLMPHSRARAVLEALETQCDPGVREAALESGELLRWDEVVEMSRGGIEIGSHALDHPVLSRLPSEEMTRQVVESRRTIEARIGRPVRFFSYPNGKREDVTPEVERTVRAAGYLGAVSTIEGRIGPRSNPFMLERKGMTKGASTNARGALNEALLSTELSGIFDLLLQRRRRGRAVH